MKSVNDIIKMSMIKNYPGDYEKFVGKDLPHNISEEELIKIKDRAIKGYIDDFQAYQIGFSDPVKEVAVCDEIKQHQKEIIGLFRFLQETYIWLMNEIPEVKELLSPLWLKEYSEEEILYIAQSAHEIITLSSPESTTLEESAKRRNYLESIGYTINE